MKIIGPKMVLQDRVSSQILCRERKMANSDASTNAEPNSNTENKETYVKCLVEQQTYEDFETEDQYQKSVDTRTWIDSCDTPKSRRRYSNAANSSLDDAENIGQTLIKGAKALDMHRQREKHNKIIISDHEILVQTPFTRMKREQAQIKQNGEEKQDGFPHTRNIAMHTNSLINNVEKFEKALKGSSNITISFIAIKKSVDQKESSSHFDNGNMTIKFSNNSPRGVMNVSAQATSVMRRKISNYTPLPATPRPSLLSKRRESTPSLPPSYSLITYLEEELDKAVVSE